MKHGTCRKCEKSASYGYTIDNIRQFCVKHKEENMTNLTEKLCLKCNLKASFGKPSGPSRVFCSKHKEVDMIHTSQRKDITSKILISK